uniref:Uncharacterized protein n=1 Tax=Streptomyces sp. F12 TaxID=1436084 RepID=V9Z4Q9_9ACTN|nr:hypothetical protein pFRL6_368 [Streptomyces sp. F12]
MVNAALRATSASAWAKTIAIIWLTVPIARQDAARSQRQATGQPGRHQRYFKARPPCDLRCRGVFGREVAARAWSIGVLLQELRGDADPNVAVGDLVLIDHGVRQQLPRGVVRLRAGPRTGRRPR